MPNCFVPYCHQGSGGSNRAVNSVDKVHTFRPQSEDQRKEWERVISRQDRNLKLTDRVCSKHFKESDISANFEHLINGKLVTIPRTRAVLRDGAVPCIFPDYPTHKQPKVCKRKSPKKRENCPTMKRIKIEQHNGEIVVESPTLPPNQDDPGPSITPVQVLSVDGSDGSGYTQSLEWSLSQLIDLKLPEHWVLCNTLEEEKKTLVYINDKTLMVDKSITLVNNCLPEIKFRGILVDNKINSNFSNKIRTTSDAEKLIFSVNLLKMCSGTGIESKKFSVFCNGAVTGKKKKCSFCKKEQDRLSKIEERKQVLESRKNKKKANAKSRIQSMRRSKARMIMKVMRYKRIIEEKMRECSQRKKEIIEEQIAKLPPKQQEAVRMCFEASKKKGPSGRRFTIEWLYECMLMRIKSPKLYDHLRTNDILPLPCNSTIRGYIKHYSGTYGFQKSTFEILEQKCKELPSEERHGVLLVDEVKLTPGLYFDQSALKVAGLKDMGDEELSEFCESVRENMREAREKLNVNIDSEKSKQKAEKNKNKRDKNLGDHALVIQYQPFRGGWVQNLACFLTKSNADAEQLTKLILEATILVEFSGLFVDGVVTDGATWNRSMWTKFGNDENNPSAEHPCCPDRQLHFISDFPHLLKCMRNCFVDKKVISTPEGDIKLKHWEAVVEADSLRAIGLKECPRLTKEHISPDSWSKMKCNLAWQFWSSSAAAGMQCFQFQGVEDLQDCDVSFKFCKMVNDLSDAMNSRTPAQALRPNSTQIQAIERFLMELERLEQHLTQTMHTALLKAEEARLKFLRKQGKNPRSQEREILKRRAYVFSESTDVGLKVTLKCTLQLLKYLTDMCGYNYLMTARLNQDALERFFGLMRQSCGPNTHPEPKVFLQLYRLLSIYSLIKPLKGSNITGGEMLSTLLNLDDLKTKSILERKLEFEKKLDNIVLSGENLEDLGELTKIAHDHSYITESIDDFALSYVAGFTARKTEKFVHDCDLCDKSLKKPAEECTDVDMLIKLKSKGYLYFPSDELMRHLSCVEKQIVTICKQNEMEENILFLIMDSLEG